MRTLSAELCAAAAALALLGTLGCMPDPKSGYGFHMPAGNAERGRAAFVALQCHSCHTVEGVELPEPAGRKLSVALGGRVARVRTYGALVTAIIDPARDVTRDLPAPLPTPPHRSLMRAVNEEMTVAQLLDIVTFLGPQYRLIVPPAEGYQPN